MTKDKIEAYLEARENLLKCFDIEAIEKIEDNSKYEWVDIDGELMYIMDDELYNFDSADLIGESEGYMLYYISDNGIEFYGLFHSNKQIIDEDEIEEKFNY